MPTVGIGTPLIRALFFVLVLVTIWAIGVLICSLSSSANIDTALIHGLTNHSLTKEVGFISNVNWLFFLFIAFPVAVFCFSLVQSETKQFLDSKSTRLHWWMLISILLFSTIVAFVYSYWQWKVTCAAPLTEWDEKDRIVGWCQAIIRNGKKQFVDMVYWYSFVCYAWLAIASTALGYFLLYGILVMIFIANTHLLDYTTDDLKYLKKFLQLYIFGSLVCLFGAMLLRVQVVYLVSASPTIVHFILSDYVGVSTLRDFRFRLPSLLPNPGDFQTAAAKNVSLFVGLTFASIIILCLCGVLYQTSVALEHCNRNKGKRRKLTLRTVIPEFPAFMLSGVGILLSFTFVGIGIYVIAAAICAVIIRLGAAVSRQINRIIK